MAADIKILDEKAWGTIASKNGLKDKDLQKALLSYWMLEDDDFDWRIKWLGKISAMAATLKKSKEAAGIPEVVKYLTQMSTTATAQVAEVTKAKALAAKTAAVAEKKEDATAGGAAGEEDEEEEEEGDTIAKLTSALKSIKTAKAPYFCLICDAKPYGLIISKKDVRKSAQAKKDLAQLAGGSTRPPKIGTCSWDGSKLVFDVEKPPSGLARIFQKWIKDNTGLGIKVMVGAESADDDSGDTADGATADAGAPGAKGTAAGAGDAPSGKGAASAEAAAGAASGAAAAAGAFKLSASVGKGGKNKPEDVTGIQNLLNTKAKSGLKVDGKCGPKTIAAIEAFQKNLGQFKPDGLISPGRGTIRALTGSAKIGPAPAPPKPVPPPQLGKPALAKAPDAWHNMRKVVDANIEEVKKAVRAHYAHEDPDLLKEIDQNLGKLDGITDKLDHRIADSLAKANAAKDDAARKAELKNSKTILTEYITYVKSEPLIAHLDSNPWVKIDLKKTLTDHLMHMAQSIG